MPTAADSGLVIAGIGASAGGLEAFSQLLASLPPDAGLAIVFVQHLSPQYESALTTLLAARSPLPVEQATDGVTVRKNHVYVIPPNVQMGIQGEVLRLSPRPNDRTQYTPIDYFLSTLASSAQERSICVIMSGTASDGTAGAAEIKAVGGITIAQAPDSAKYDGMPRAAIASKSIDLVLTPAEIAAELASIARHPLRQIARESPAEVTPPVADKAEPQMEQIFALLRSSSGVDFRRYKRATIERRLQRRMVLHKLERLEQYISLLRHDPAEVQAFYSDILIHVTRFFRDPDSFAAIASQVLPRISGNMRDEAPIRVWVPGCSTGEEAYSIGILVLEHLPEIGQNSSLQVFATDISDSAIEHARAGVYAETIAADVGPERLARFFSKVEGGYRVHKNVRDSCIFARQDLTRDPPFSKLDLILCRNVLIYLGAEAQRKLMGVFHYALRPQGFLVLGSAETVGGSSDLFGTVDRKYHIYENKPGSAPEMHFQMDYGVLPSLNKPSQRAANRVDGMHIIESEATRVLQERYSPPGVIVDRQLNVVQFRGQTGTFLEPPPGEPSANLLKMAREGLLHSLRDAVQAVRKRRTPVHKPGVRVRSNGGWQQINLDVIPLAASDGAHLLILFDAIPSKARSRKALRSQSLEHAGTEKVAKRVARLQDELASSREYLQSIIQDLEAANEELQSANEEVLSANEELQSTNEELDTAKEELQSTNEELNTVNDELHARNGELSRVNSDLVNLLSSVQIAIVIVAGDLRIRRFTPTAERILNLMPGDVGRPIGHIKPNIDCPDLEDLIHEVIDTVTPCEREVRDPQGNTLSLRIRPYKNLDHCIEGAVLALFDNNRPPPIEGVQESVLTDVVGAAPCPMLLLDAEQRVVGVNRAFTKLFGFSAREVEGTLLRDLGGGGWNFDGLRNLMDGHELDGDDAMIEHEFPRVGRKRVGVSLRRFAATHDGSDARILLAFEDLGPAEHRSG